MKLQKIDTNSIPDFLDAIQRTSACHLKFVTVLKTSIEEDNEDKLLPFFFKCLRHAFLANYKEKNPYIEKVLNFFVLFASSFKSTTVDGDAILFHPVLHSIFTFLLKLSNSANDSHRFWSCTLFNKIFENIAELSNELYKEVRESMLQRLKDIRAAIRCQAVIALHRLQDPSDPEDPIICHLCELVQSDYNAKVRKLCVEKVALNKYALPFVMQRTRDVDVNVRLTAFQKLKSSAKYLKVSQKRLLLQCGFCDANEKIQYFVSTVFLEHWLESYDNNYLKLMSSIRLDASEEDIATTIKLVELMLKALFKSASVEKILSCININGEKLIDYENLNWESILYYRIAVQYLRQSDGFEDILSSILPELVYFCKYVKGYTKFMTQIEKLENNLLYEFTVQQLFIIIQGYDVSDAASRQCLNSLVHYVLQNGHFTADTAEVIVRTLEKTITNINNRSIFICEMISNIVYGDAVDYEELETKEMERTHAISQLQSDINSLQEQESHYAFVEENFMEADRVKQEIENKKMLLIELRTVKEKQENPEKKKDVVTMVHCLTLAEALLRSPSLKEFNPAIATLNSEIIHEALIHEDHRVKIQAIKCYALCCIIDESTARYGIHLFSCLLFAENTAIEVLLTSLKVIVDVLVIYGLSLVEKREDEEPSDSRQEEERKVFVGGTSLTDLIQALANYLDHEDPQVQYIAARGVSALLTTSRITSSSLLSRIIIKWANPATESELIKQFIGFSLNDIAASPDSNIYLGDAIISTIKTLVYAPSRSPLADVDIDNITKFMVMLTQLGQHSEEIQKQLAFDICNQMRAKPTMKVNFFFTKVLLQLNIFADEELLSICDQLKDVLTDSQTLRNINKFTIHLTKKGSKLMPIIE